MTIKQDTKKICQLLLKKRGIEKEKSTYYDSIEELISPDNKLHAKYNHNLTDTGRLSSSDPNMQNLPKSPSKVKQYFVTRFKET